MNHSLAFLRLISVSLTLILFSNSVGYTKEPSSPNLAVNRGEWIIESASLSNDRGLGTDLTQQATEDNCYGIVTLKNQTGIPILPFMRLFIRKGLVHLPESTTKGWSAKLRYQGKPSEAENATTAFFEEKGRTIVENNPLDLGGSTLLLQREQANGFVVIDVDPNDPSVTLNIATFFL